MAASFGAFRPRVRFYWDATTFHIEGDNVPDRARMPDLMVGISSWQQQIPLPASYFAGTVNPERDSKSLGFGQPNVWRLPLVPTPAAQPIPISSGNFQRGAIAVAVDGIAIFNPRNNRGVFSYEIGELDLYGGHCGLADDYHYHIAPVHLQAKAGAGQPIAWALDGYPIYGYMEPDGSARQTLDADGGHNHGLWNYHYHAIGSAVAGPQSPYLPAAFHGTVVNYGGQVDGQPEVSPIRPDGSGGYTAKPVTGASIIAFRNPVALVADGAGHLSESASGEPSPDNFLLRVKVGTATYDECWRINRAANPASVTVTWRLPTITTTTATYAGGQRLTAYPMSSPSLLRLPDTGQTTDSTTVFGEDSDYAINPTAFTDNGDGTVTDRVTGLMWQKTDAGETTWENALAKAGTVDTGGHRDWRLPTPTELFSIMNHEFGNPAALDTAFFPSNPAGAAEYWWTTDIYGADGNKVWCVNSGGGMGPKPKSETLSAGGKFRYHARYVRGAAPGNGHNYLNNLDGTVTDLDTGLMWTQVPGPAVSWTEALAYAENLTLAGFVDWRLPNIKELQSLVDYTLATATTATAAVAPVNRVLFPPATTPAAAYWSSTSLRGAGTSTSAWLIEFGVNTSVPATAGPPRGAQGIVSYETRDQRHPVFAVRGPVANAASFEIRSVTGNVTVKSGGPALVAVDARGSGLYFQWYRGLSGDVSSPIEGAVRSYLLLERVTAAANQWVRVRSGDRWLDSATTTVSVGAAGAPLSARQSVAGFGYIAGARTAVHLEATLDLDLERLDFSLLLPSGWTLREETGASATARPAPGTANALEWTWLAPKAGIVALDCILAVPPGTTGTQEIVSLLSGKSGGLTLQALAGPDPLPVPPGPSFHSADTNRDHRISLLELTRVIELYATRNETTRTGAYRPDPASEDGFSPDPARPPSTTEAVPANPHTADTSRDGRISLAELVRVIELYNTRAGTVRTGEYAARGDTEDGFVPGPSP